MYRSLIVASRITKTRQPTISFQLTRQLATGATKPASTSTSDKWSTPSTDQGANRQTTQNANTNYGTNQTDDKIPLQQENQHRGQQSEAAAKAEKSTKDGKTSTTIKPTSSSTSSSTSGRSASDHHRSQHDYTDRDQGTGSEASVAADRSTKDPLPPHEKHSTKKHNQ